jgi:hypothetical protein
MIRWGPHRERLEALKKQGRKIKALDSETEPYEENRIVKNAWIELHNRRNGSYPINIEAIIMWLDMREIKGDEREFIFDMVCAMDNYWISQSQSRRKTNG